jgi:hypothetical protein
MSHAVHRLCPARLAGCVVMLTVIGAVVAHAQPMSGVYPVGSGGPGVDSFATVQAAANALNVLAGLSAEGAEGAKFYKKVCSTFRGNVGAELDAVMDVLNVRRVALVPAFPQIGGGNVCQ